VQIFESSLGNAPKLLQRTRRSSLGILTWNKCRLVSRRPSWKVGSICAFWVSLESKFWRITYCFAFFSCEERLFPRSVGGDDHCTASQEAPRWRERLPSFCTLASLLPEVKSQSSSKILMQNAFDYCWYGQGYILLGVIWKNLCGFSMFSIKMIQPVISTVKSLLKLPLKAHRKLDPKLLILISIVEISFLWECFMFS